MARVISTSDVPVSNLHRTTARVHKELTLPCSSNWRGGGSRKQSRPSTLLETNLYVKPKQRVTAGRNEFPVPKLLLSKTATISISHSGSAHTRGGCWEEGHDPARLIDHSGLSEC